MDDAARIQHKIDQWEAKKAKVEQTLAELYAMLEGASPEEVAAGIEESDEAEA